MDYNPLIPFFENGSVEHNLDYGLNVFLCSDGYKIYKKLFATDNIIKINNIFTQLFAHHRKRYSDYNDFDHFFQKLIEIYKNIKKTSFTWLMIYNLLANGFPKQNVGYYDEKYYFSQSLINILNNCEQKTCFEILEDLYKRKKSIYGRIYTLLYDYNEARPENELHMNHRMEAIIFRKDYQTIIKIYGKEIFLFVYGTTPLNLVIENIFNHNMHAVSLLFNQPNLRAFKLVANKIEQVISSDVDTDIINICRHILPEYYKNIFDQIDIIYSGINERIQYTYKFGVITENISVLRFVFHFLKYFNIDLDCANIALTIEHKIGRPRILMLLSYETGYCQDCFKIAIKKSAEDQIYIHNIFVKRLPDMIKYIQPFIGGNNYDYTGIIKLINLYLPLQNIIY